MAGMPHEEKSKAPWIAAAGAVPALAMYGLARRGRMGLMGASATSKARRLGVGLGSDHVSDSPFVNYLMHGTKHVGLRAGIKAPPGAFAKAVRGAGLVFDPSRSSTDLRRMFGGNVATQGYDPKMIGKVGELEYFRKAKGLFADSKNLSSYRLKGDIHARGQQLANKLKGQQYVMKHDEDFNSLGTLITDKTNIHSLLKQYHGTPKGRAFIKEVNKAFMDEDTNQGAYILGAAPKRLAQYYRLQRMLGNPTKSFVQKRENLATNKGLEGFLGRFTGRKTPSEYRIHVINGKVVRGTSLARQTYLQEAFDVLGVPNPNMSAAEKWLEQRLAQMPKHKLKGRSYGFDVAPLKGGGFRAMESNPTSVDGSSGFLFSGDRAEQAGELTKFLDAPKANWKSIFGHTPDEGFSPTQSPLLKEIGSSLNSHRLVSSLQGRDTHLLAALKSVLAGGAGLGAYGTYSAAS